MGNTSNYSDCNAGSVPETEPASSFTRWLKLILWVVLLYSFMVYWGPWLLVRIPGYQPILKAIDEYGIDANQYYYTEVEEFSDARVDLQNTMDYMPKGTIKKHTGKNSESK